MVHIILAGNIGNGVMEMREAITGLDDFIVNTNVSI